MSYESNELENYMLPIIVTSLTEPHTFLEQAYPFPAFHTVSAPIHLRALLVLIQQNCGGSVRLRYAAEIHLLPGSPGTQLQG